MATLNEYRSFVESMTLESADCVEYGMANLAGECGEVLGRWSKWIRDGGDEEEYLADIQKELGDVMFMWMHLHNQLKLDPDATIQKNIDKLESRKKRDKIGGSGNDR